MMRKLFILLSILLAALSCGGIHNVRSVDSMPAAVVSSALSNSKVTSFCEDDDGHIWIGTARGLNKYTGTDYYQYFSYSDSEGLPDNEIYWVRKDRDGRLWVSTAGGVCRRDAAGRFIRPASERTRLIMNMLEAPDGRLFFDNKMEILEYVPDFDSLRVVISYEPVQLLMMEGASYITSSGDMLIVVGSELRIYDTYTFELKETVDLGEVVSASALDGDVLLYTGSGGLKAWSVAEKNLLPLPESLRDNPLLHKDVLSEIWPLGEGALMLNTRRDGLFHFDFRTGKLTGQRDPSFPFLVPDSKISGIFVDSRNNLWCSLYYNDAGFAVAYATGGLPVRDRMLEEAVSGIPIVSAGFDSKGILWLASLQGDLYLYDHEREQIDKIPIQDYFGMPFSETPVLSQMAVDRNDDIWLSFYDSSPVRRYFRSGNRLVLKRTYPVERVLSFMEDDSGDMWMGTYSNFAWRAGGGDGSFGRLELYPEGYTHISCILNASFGMIAGAFSHDIQVFDPEKLSHGSLVDFQTFSDVIVRSEYIPTVFYQDRSGLLWIGTDANGLLRYDPSDGSLVPVPGASCDDIACILEDSSGNLWISTQYGLSRYDREDGSFSNYLSKETLGGLFFFDRCGVCLPDGRMVFGGMHGVTMFNPSELASRRSVSLVFEQLKIHNEPVAPGPGQAIDRDMSSCPDVHLSWRDDGFSIAYAALDYGGGEKPGYSYMLEGYDNIRVEAGDRQEAYYSHVPAGTYKFRVWVTGSSGGIEEKEISLNIIKKRAPWTSWWAILLYALAACAVLALLIRSGLSIRRHALAARRAEAEKEQERQASLMNRRFFANIAHEFRTPLTMISGPISMVERSPNLSAKERSLMNSTGRSVNRMLQLVNQLMDFNKLENGNLKLSVSLTGMVGLIEDITDIFKVNAEAKGISFNVLCHEKTFDAWVDADKVNKMLSNLLSNAFKFTPEGGTVSVVLDILSREQAGREFPMTEDDTDSLYVRISVTDTGPGIPDSQKEKIFERYYQVDGKSGVRYNYGTGIGLYFSRALARLHHGYLTVADRAAGSGSVFSLLLPVHEEAYSRDEIASAPSESPAAQKPSVSKDLPVDEPASEGLQNILIVDDDVEIAHYLKVLFSSIYRVRCCFDVESAMEEIRKEAPELVISDVAMPGKDGYQLCDMIKKDATYCHIPVVLVTAKITVEDQVRGLEKGADAYVTKPFDPVYLLALVKSQLENRERMRSRIKSAASVEEASDEALSAADNAFLRRLYALMEKELANPEIDVNVMSEKLAISRSKLYYKVQGLTGETPAGLFRRYKLNKAAQLLIEGSHNISEIADLTGFSTPAHFSTLFKKHFGVTPSEYKG